MNEIERKKADLEQQAREQEKKEREADAKVYAAYAAAKRVYNNYGLGFYRDGQPRYFYKILTTKRDKHGTEMRMLDLKYSGPSSLYPNFVELQSDMSRQFLRRMIEGETLQIKSPDGEFIEETFERRVYDKMTNTTKLVDDKTYNLVDVSHKLMPQDVDDECPIILRALLYAVTGNQIVWNEKHQDWDCDKPETLEWFEKWLYGVVHASIGDWSLSMPIIFGSGKVGKNALFDIVIKNCLGEWCTFTSTWDIFNSNFDAFKIGKVFVFIDEIPERSEWERIKNATGSQTQYVKQKYGPEFEIDNCIAYAMGSNKTSFPLPWEDGEQMMRVSPIRTHKNSTFAGNTVKMLSKKYGETFVDDLIRASGNNPDTMTEFKKGDYILRSLMASDWQTPEAAQQLLNYLHKKYGGNTYQLAPLRATDWHAIAQTKVEGISETVAFIVEHDPEVIPLDVLYEIYCVFMDDDKRCKNKPNFLGDVQSVMLEHGYEYKQSAKISADTRVKLFAKIDLPHGRLTKIPAESVMENVNYIEVLQDSVGKSVRRLRWATEKEAQINKKTRMSGELYTD